jgi:hypothetical protein
MTATLIAMAVGVAFFIIRRDGVRDPFVYALFASVVPATAILFALASL